DGRVTTMSVVEDLHEFEDRLSRLRPGCETTRVDQLVLQGREEALGDCVVPAVTLPAHAADDAQVIECVLVVSAGVLRSAIRVVKEPGVRDASSNSVAERFEHECAVNMIAHREPD